MLVYEYMPNKSLDFYLFSKFKIHSISTFDFSMYIALQVMFDVEHYVFPFQILLSSITTSPRLEKAFQYY